MFQFLTLVTLNATRVIRVAVLAQASLTHPKLHPPAAPLKLKMASAIDRSFQTLLNDCGVSSDFQRFLQNATLINPARFLAAIPRNIDDDLIAEYRNNGARPTIPP